MAQDNKPELSDASGNYSGSGQSKDRRREERQQTGVYGADAEEGPDYHREDKEEGGRYGVKSTIPPEERREKSSEMEPEEKAKPKDRTAPQKLA